MSTRWRPRLGGEARRDLLGIVHWTARHFGAAQARAYRETILIALSALEAGPDISGSKARDEIMPWLRTLHVARGGRRGRHIILYRAQAQETIDVVRILHDSMDLGRHMPGSAEE